MTPSSQIYTAFLDFHNVAIVCCMAWKSNTPQDKILPTRQSFASSVNVFYASSKSISSLMAISPSSSFSKVTLFMAYVILSIMKSGTNERKKNKRTNWQVNFLSHTAHVNRQDSFGKNKDYTVNSLGVSGSSEIKNKIMIN